MVAWYFLRHVDGSGIEAPSVWVTVLFAGVAVASALFSAHCHRKAGK